QGGARGGAKIFVGRGEWEGRRRGGRRAAARWAQPAAGPRGPACPPFASRFAFPTRCLRAACRELVLEGEEVEEGEFAVAVEVGAKVPRGVEVLEGQEVEEGEFAIAVEIGAAEEAGEIEDVR